jgi:OOP family OmpA-OmpF porin
MLAFRRLFATLVAGLLLCLPARAAAQTRPSLDLRTWQPSSAPDAGLVLEPVQSPGSWQWNVGAWGSYAQMPVVLRHGSTNGATVDPVAHALGADLVASLGLGNQGAIGVDLPLTLFQDGTSGLPAGVVSGGKVPTGAVGDVVLLGKGTLLRNDPHGIPLGFGLSLLTAVSLPTGDRRSFAGDGSVTVSLRALAEYALGVGAVRATLGYTLRTAQETWPDPALGGVVFGDAIPWSLGATLRPKGVLPALDSGDRQSWELAFHGALPATPVAPFQPGASRLSPALLALDDRIELGHYHDTFFLGGVDLGLDHAEGVPVVRFVVALGWAPRAHDRDSDGVPDDADQCPELAEDKDGIQDEDGCPEDDADGDGILDTQDACPLVPGVWWNDPKKNGCPAPDTDGDGIPDPLDACPAVKGAPSEDPKKNGCPPVSPGHDKGGSRDDAVTSGGMPEALAQPMPRRPGTWIPGSGMAPGLPPALMAAPPPDLVEATSGDLRMRFGVDIALKLLGSTDADERLRGVERAAATRTPEGLSLLERASRAGPRGEGAVEGAARQDPRALLAVVRGLASFADHETARAALESLLSPASATAMHGTADGPDPAADEAESAARVRLALEEAAMALARSGSAEAVEGLVATARSGGPGQAAALQALAAYPPVTPRLGGVALTTPEMIALAVNVGDLRSVGAILGVVHASDPALRAAAIAALGIFGDARALDVARDAAKDKDARVRVAGADALGHLGAADAAPAVEALIAADSTARDGLRLARNVASEGVTKAAAARAAASADPELRALALAALGRQGSPAAVGALVALAGDGRQGGDVMDALARSPGPAAMAAIETMATSSASSATRRLVGRAYFVRRMVRDERSKGGDALLAALAASENGADRAVGMEALVALGEKPLDRALDDGDPRVRRAAAMGSLALSSTRTCALLTAHFAVEADETTRRVLGAGLVEGDPGAVVPTATLIARAQAGGPDAPLAGLALARRAGDELTPEVDALLASRDPVMRSHVARGLRASDAPDAGGRLARAYAWEPVAEVRRALIEALAAHAGDARAVPSFRETLEVAAELDPDGVTRALARGALDGRAPAGREVGREVAWLRVVPAEGGVLPRELTGRVEADGVAWPIAFDEDGYALVPGLVPGDVRLGLAPRLPTYEPR